MLAYRDRWRERCCKWTEDVFAPSLMSHRLKGEYDGLRACSCGYDCRIIFSIEKNEQTNEEEIVLLNVGSHDEVY